MTTRPTLRTISELSGLAVPTVSRALNDAPDISNKTKLRVKKIAADIGYLPNRAGLRLRTGRTNVISLVLATDHDIMNQTSRMISSVANGLRGTPYHLNIMPYLPDEDRMAPIRYIVETGAADAIIINQIEPKDVRVQYLLEKQFPFVTHGRSQWQKQHPYFDYDNRGFAAIGVKTLNERAVKKILLIAPPRAQFYATEMCEGAQSAAKALDVEIDIPSAITSDDLNADVRRFVAEYLDANNDVGGIIAGSANSAIAAAKGSEDAGRVIGGDIQILTKEAMPFLQLFREELIVFNEDIENAGTFLAKAAMHAINHSDEAPMQMLDRPKGAEEFCG